jgi:hypothetical protein
MDLALVISAGIAVAGVVLTLVFLPASNAPKTTVQPVVDADGEAAGKPPHPQTIARPSGSRPARASAQRISPTAVRTASHENNHAIDLAELSHRDRDEIRQILGAPVCDPAPLPWRGGPVGRLAGLTASALRTTGGTLKLLARCLDP